MNSPKQSQRFAEIEYCLQRYFDGQLAPVMGNVQQELSKKQIKEYSDYTTSINGILRSAASGMNGMPDDSMQFVKLTGEWNSKTAEDYVEMCHERISSSKGFQKDLGCMAEEWRNAVVAEIGRERYETLSKELGGDLAFAYVDYRVEQMMINKQEIAEVRNAVQMLPEKYRIPICLSYSAGLTMEEIATCMKVPVNTVKTRIRKAKSILKQELEARGIDR